jgi:hypothetical protein
MEAELRSRGFIAVEARAGQLAICNGAAPSRARPLADSGRFYLDHARRRLATRGNAVEPIFRTFGIRRTVRAGTSVARPREIRTVQRFGRDITLIYMENKFRTLWAKCRALEKSGLSENEMRAVNRCSYGSGNQNRCRNSGISALFE